MPRKPLEGGVGSSGTGVTDCNQFHNDHIESNRRNFMRLRTVECDPYLA